MCLDPCDAANDANSCEEYCGPLSLLTTSGMPNREKIDLRIEMTVAEVVLVNLTTSGNHKIISDQQILVSLRSVAMICHG